MIGQECFDASLRHELAAQGRSIEELRVGFSVSLHAPILDHRENASINRRFFQQAPSVLEG